MKRNPEETMKEEVPTNEKEALKKACDIVEAKIRERGGQMHTKSQIRTYKVGDEIVVRLDDVLELARVMKNKFREGKEPGYISRRNLYSGHISVNTDSFIRKSVFDKELLCLVYLAELFFRYLLAVNKSARKAGIGRLIPGGNIECLCDISDIFLIKTRIL